MGCSRQVIVALLQFLLVLFTLWSLLLNHVFIVHLFLITHSLTNVVVAQLHIEI